ncbi:MAG: hypothetical protein WAW86_03840 [Gammaproteobacteria bacterium]
MSSLKSQIKNLEAKVIADQQEFVQQRKMIVNQVLEYKEDVYAFGLIFGGFTLGYMLGPSKGHAIKRAMTGGMLFLNASRWIQLLV